MPNNRGGRINGELQKNIYDIISRKLKNPLIEQMFSVVKVDCAADLKNARVYISVFSGTDEQRKRTFDAIYDSASQIRYELAKIMHVRTVPELNIIYDDTEEQSAKIEALLHSIKQSDKED